MQLELHVGRDGRVRGEQFGGAPGEIRGVLRHLVGLVAGRAQLQPGRGTRHHVVVHRHGLEHGRQVVVAVRAQRADGQVQVDLRRYANAYRVGDLSEGHRTPIVSTRGWPSRVSHRLRRCASLKGMRTVGVEEELMLFTASGFRPAPAGEELAEDPATEVEHEFKLEQAEIASSPATDLGALREDLVRRRAELIEAARARGVIVAAIGTSPLGVAADRDAGRALPAHARALRVGRA